jgi:hypothetical protein
MYKSKNIRQVRITIKRKSIEIIIEDNFRHYFYFSCCNIILTYYVRVYLVGEIVGKRKDIKWIDVVD